MAALSLSYVFVYAMRWALADWPVFVFVIAAYIGLALGWGWFSEVRAAVKEREQAESDLRKTSEDLRESHADLQLAQWKLIEAEKLEAVGQLAAGVAHEVKNPLMTLMTGVRYLSAHVSIDDEKVKLLLGDMLEAVERANAVITGLLDFSALRELNLRPAKLNTLVEQSARLVKNELDKAHVTLHKELGKAIPEIPLDGFKIQQVLVNVLTNAAHATPPGGRITGTTEVAPELLIDGALNGQDAGQVATGRHLVLLRVDDTGRGIPEDKLRKLFDPFFTTKPAGKGTGLGLAVTRQIVEMHDGTIDIRNRDEGGARVTITFKVPGESADA